MEAVEIARERVLCELEDGLPLIFEADADFRPGSSGWSRGGCAKNFTVPSVVVEMGEEESRGSCRSIPEFDITQALDQCADLLVRHGGHAQAAGFTVRNENLPGLRDKLIALAGESLRGKDLRPTLDIDAEVPFDELTMELADSLRNAGTERVEQRSADFHDAAAACGGMPAGGQEGKHLKLRLSNGFYQIDAIGFKLGDWAERIPPIVDVAYHLEINQWNGSTQAATEYSGSAPGWTGRPVVSCES